MNQGKRGALALMCALGVWWSGPAVRAGNEVEMQPLAAPARLVGTIPVPAASAPMHQSMGGGAEASAPTSIPAPAASPAPAPTPTAVLAAVLAAIPGRAQAAARGCCAGCGQKLILTGRVARQCIASGADSSCPCLCLPCCVLDLVGSPALECLGAVCGDQDAEQRCLERCCTQVLCHTCQGLIRIMDLCTCHPLIALSF